MTSIKRLASLLLAAATVALVGLSTSTNRVAERDFEDKVSSVDNNSPNWWKMFENRGYTGYTVCVRPWGYDSDLGNNTSFEDDASSAKRQGTSQPGGCDKIVG